MAAISGFAEADDGPAIIPTPANVQTASDTFPLRETTTILISGNSPELRAVGELLSQQIKSRTGWALKLRGGAPDDDEGRDIIRLGLMKGPPVGSEGYDLTIIPEEVRISSGAACGVFYGVQTLLQLLPPTFNPKQTDSEGRQTILVPCLGIVDKPRFAHRGMLLDCGRHFMPKELIKRQIDLLAMHKMNVLHWHLTEDQGWRIEIKRYPKLTEIGAWREVTRESEKAHGSESRATGSRATNELHGSESRATLYGGFYTQDDIREIVAYAKARYVTVIPEIELPGHSLAALAAYPELSCTGGPFKVGTAWGVYEDVYCAGSDQTFEFLEGVLSEVVELFPSQYVHIGGDECPKTRWKACPKCQARIKAEGLKDEHELQSYFIRRIEKFLSGKGKRIIGWDEILEGGLAPNATVQSWRGLDGAIAAARAGHDVVCSPTSHCYLDYPHQKADAGYPEWMGEISLEKAYSFEPVPAELTTEQARHILGVECNLWTEHAPPALADRQTFPRLCALAEVAWSSPEVRRWEDFQRRLRAHYARLDALGVAYYVPPPRIVAEHDEFADSLDITLAAAHHEGVIRYTLDGTGPTATSPAYDGKPIRLLQTTTVRARTELPANAQRPAARLGTAAQRKFQKRGE